ncbi:ankyrin repeat domain-containing protein [Streptomyces sp. AcE210]|uniref:ankyrin repeat domain-containing protein n=1 Tax=Streptomyces sp. AcE210 TaxID=2292703 RepID=UPI000E30B3E5|nr:ankyrin repeat domain-containing protein [Streptomyces sp. AcE210]RFC69958.1 ankyrin repeat domain-containing protein [Streptomyces sp. AcE210]
MAQVNSGWSDVRWEDWQDADNIRRRLDQGADPEVWGGGRPLHRAAAFGSPEVVAELARRVRDVDALDDGTTALWEAVVGNRPDNARALAAAGADPWRPQFGGWSPGRLSLAGPAPDLFPVPEGERGLIEPERTVAREGRRLVEALGTFDYEGTGLACVAGIDAEEAIRRLEANPADGEDLEELLDDPYAFDMDESLQIVGVTTVPGGCVVTQPWGYAPQMPGVMTMLSAGTYSYGLYANPKSGNQGIIARDRVIEGSDLHPGGGPDHDDTSEEVLFSYLFQHNAVAYSCARAGLRLTDARAVIGPPDRWVELPRRDYWTYS